MEKRLYIDKYIKCMVCGKLVYGEQMTEEVGGQKYIFCSDWCRQWFKRRSK